MMKRILDACCGGKMFWFDKENPDVLFGDIRKENHILCDERHFEINPDVRFDFANMPFKDESFQMVVFDPPHLERAGKNSWVYKKYGKLNPGWALELREGFSECFRVLKIGGTLIFKWSEIQIPVSRVLSLVDKKPLFVHRSGKKANTHWVSFIK